MPQARQTARSSRREELTDSLRIYGLEGITETQDEALTQLALTSARHDERLNASEVTSAVHSEQIGALVRTNSTLTESVSQLNTMLFRFSFAVAGSAIGVACAVVFA